MKLVLTSDTEKILLFLFCASAIQTLNTVIKFSTLFNIRHDGLYAAVG